MTSDYQIFKNTGIGHARLSNWRTGKDIPDDSAVLQICQVTGLPADYWLARAQAARTKSPAARAAWESIAARFAAGFLLCAVALPMVQDVSARGLELCITSNRRQWDRFVRNVLKWRGLCVWARFHA
jgi:transcriptional regulator with XRE-family HTH domain